MWIKYIFFFHFPTRDTELKNDAKCKFINIYFSLKKKSTQQGLTHIGIVSLICIVKNCFHCRSVIDICIRNPSLIIVSQGNIMQMVSGLKATLKLGNGGHTFHNRRSPALPGISEKSAHLVLSKQSYRLIKIIHISRSAVAIGYLS